MFVAAHEAGLCRIELPGRTEQAFLEKIQQGFDPSAIHHRAHPFIKELEEQLEGYFSRNLRVFDVPLSWQGTPFQVSVWKELLKIPYGERTSYIELARRIGNPLSVRAVGTANGANPLPIVIPCHRVVGTNGKLIGYGGGLEMKRRLLELESPQAPLKFEWE